MPVRGKFIIKIRLLCSAVDISIDPLFSPSFYHTKGPLGCYVKVKLERSFIGPY